MTIRAVHRGISRYDVRMPLRSARRLPRRYNRPVSARTRALADRRRTHQRKLKQERVRRLLRRFQRLYVDWQQFVVRWFLVGIVLALLFALGFLLFSPVVHIRSISIQRTDPRLDIEHVQQALAPLFGRHTVFLSELEVLTLLREAVPDIDQVEVQKSYPSDITVAVTLDALVAKVQIISPDEPQDAEAAPTATGAVQNYLSSDGMLITTSLPQDPDLPLIRLVDWGARPQQGDTVLPVEFFIRMRQAEEQLTSQFSLNVLERTIFLRGQEFHLRVSRESQQGSAVNLWFDLRSPLADHLQRYRAFLRAAGPDVAQEYIDLRLQDRVVYK